MNSKFLDIGLRLPRALGDKELETRNLLSEHLQRGKINVTIEYIKKDGASSPLEINRGLFVQYYKTLKELAEEVDAGQEDIFRMAMQYPDVVIPLEDDHEKEKEWESIRPVLVEAIKKCDEFREKEGKALADKILTYIHNIEQGLEKIEKLDPERVERIKGRLEGSLVEVIKQGDIDQNRLEQELIFYIEKLDISEEKVRLKSHLNYFEEILSHGASMGKKMNFIAQEMGREINTIGSKANDAEMQKIVVSMKDELEKIKEQLLNVL